MFDVGHAPILLGAGTAFLQAAVGLLYGGLPPQTLDSADPQAASNLSLSVPLLHSVLELSKGILDYFAECGSEVSACPSAACIACSAYLIPILPSVAAIMVGGGKSIKNGIFNQTS